MRLSIAILGWELDLSLAPENVTDDEITAEFGPYQDAGSTGSYPIGYAPSPQPEWVRPLNRYDEPSEGDEDV